MRARPSRARLACSYSLAVACLCSCAGHADALERGQRLYEDNQYERALALWRELDRREAAFGPRERARYAYFRGMTDYRLGFRDDARHWLAIAKATDAQQPGALVPTWLERLDGALTDLGREALGLRPDGSDAVQTIELAPGGSTSSIGAPADSTLGEAAPGDARSSGDAGPSGAAAAGEPLPTDPGASPLPAPRR